MTTILSDACNPIFARHETFHPRYGWLRKAFVATSKDPAAFSRSNATVALGVGKNMVNAIRYWGLAYKVLKEAPNPASPRVPNLVPTSFANALLAQDGWDPYLEDAGSLWLLHWQLLKPRCLAPVWWIAFNGLASIDFTEPSLTARAVELASLNGWPTVVQGSVQKDADCVVRMFLPRRTGRQTADDVLDCPFRELRLLEPGPEPKSWRLSVGEKPGLPDAILSYACLDYASREKTSSISLGRLAFDPGGPGRAFCLDETALHAALARYASQSTEIDVAETNGIRQLVFHGDPQSLGRQALLDYYGRISGSAKVWEDEADELSLGPRSRPRDTERVLAPVTHASPDLRRTARPPIEVPRSADALRGFLRSVNIERDQGDFHPTYMPTARAIDVIRRFTNAMRGHSGTRAWSITGPYGAGKSSFAAFLAALLSPEGDSMRRKAEQRLARMDPSLLRALRQGRAQLGATEKGFIRALATAAHEPVAATVLRALEQGIRERWPTRRPDRVSVALADCTRHPSDARRLTELVKVLAAYAPVLIVIDEFGKNLEYFARAGGEGDVYPLQTIVEWSSGAEGASAFVITMQHMGFEDYAPAASERQRREWSKVQGRFEDVSFAESIPDTVALIAEVLGRQRLPSSLEAPVKNWAREAFKRTQALGLAQLLPGTQAILEATYPLNPVSLLVLPDLCSRFAQHRRTLFSFLCGGEEHSASAFLSREAVPNGKARILPLDRVYDYFVTSVATMIASSTEGSRFLEIATRIREVAGLPALEERCLKAIGLLNLVSQGGALRASPGVLSFALDDGSGGRRTDLRPILDALQARGLVTYREFADEFRVWQGTDVDLNGYIARAREALRSRPPSYVVREAANLGPIVAARHSQRVGMLRYFDVTVADSSTRRIAGPRSDDPADGTVVYCIDSPDQPVELEISGDKPVVTVRAAEAGVVVDAALDVLAISSVMTDSSEVSTDWVARREAFERLALARRRFSEAFAQVFTSPLAGAEWRLEHPLGAFGASGHTSRLLSDICDSEYSASPEVRSEMLGRRDLTSQAAKARRLLLEAMVEHGSRPRLAIEGYGPERSMYEAILAEPGMHRQGTDGIWRFSPPRQQSSYAQTWKVLVSTLEGASTAKVSVDAVYSGLKGRPVGLKDGVIPVLLATFLLCHSDDVAIYQDGTYQPVLSADLIERLIKTPERFALKKFDLKSPRQEVLDALSEATGVIPLARRRNPSVIQVAAPLLQALRELPDYCLQTRTVSAQAMSVRDVLRSAREPDELVFAQLPRACGLEPFAPSRRPRLSDVARYADTLKGAVNELRMAFRDLLLHVADRLSIELAVSRDVSVLRADLSSRARRVSERVIDPYLRAFLHSGSDTRLDEDDWLEALALTVSGKPPRSWSDEDRGAFDAKLHDACGRLRRVEALYFEMVATGTDGFEARRVTVTLPTGDERSSVVWMDDADRSMLDQLASTSIEAATSALGARGAEALLVALAERVLEESLRNGAQATWDGDLEVLNRRAGSD